MGDVAIRVKNLSKKYKIGVAKTRHDTLRDQLMHALKSLVSRNGHAIQSTETFWALKDVSFDVKQGEVVGMIGRNGAGKSTLLKILSRITKPTEGFAEIHGRVGSLLEVGTGFHGELTGRENIYLNGAILGMKKAEIDRKFDEIVDFSGVEKFIDTPVKRYSSGMYVRLAFAVAAHLETEILIVDEVLAVGDVAFQNKCLGKINDITSEGRTVLFVSHSMAKIQALCQSCLLLELGQLVLKDETPKVIDRYLTVADGDLIESPVVELWSHPRRHPKRTPALKRIWMTGGSRTTSMVPMGSEVTFHVEYQAETPVPQPIVGLTFETRSGTVVCGTNNLFGEGAKVVNASLSGVLSFRIPSLPLVSGEYFITATFAKWIDRDLDRIERAFKFTVLPADIYGTGLVPDIGHCALHGHWDYSPLNHVE